MKFFIDTGNLAQIKEAYDLGILDGVTTNPTLMAKEGVKGEEAIANHYKTICEMADGDVSAEVLFTFFYHGSKVSRKNFGTYISICDFATCFIWLRYCFFAF